ncbi:MAG: DNA repair exonuclease [Verrucomicrobiae bacterium]
MLGIKILCTADLHLGRTSSIGQEVDLDISALGAWRRIADLAIAGGADAVVIAGDVFDSLASSLQERKRFHDGVVRLSDAGIPVVAVTGNHDHDALPAYAAAFSHESFLLLGLRGWEAREITTKSGPVRFVGQSFTNVYERAPATSPDLEPMPGVPTVAILHGDLAPNSAYRPVSPSVLDRPADAWVLGHIHIPLRIASAKVPSIYPGSPQALDFGETGLHGVNWLEIQGTKAAFGPSVPISTVRYDIETVDVSEESGPPDLVLGQAVRDRARRLSPETPSGGYCALRVAALVSGDSDKLLQGLINGDGFEWQLMSITVPPSIDDVFRDVADSSAVGQTARIIAGLLADLGDSRAAGREIPPGWIRLARRVTEQSATEMQLQYRSYLGKAAADHRMEHLPPDLPPDEANKKAKQLLLSASLDLYRQLSEQLKGGAA